MPSAADGAALEVFCSYSHKDESLLLDFQASVAILRRKKLVDVWTDHRIVAGQLWSEHIRQRLARAQIVVLLVSADFLHSDYCYTNEMSEALVRVARSETTVVPVILRPCDWAEAPFAHLQALPRNGKPVTSWDNRDAAWTDVAIGLKTVVKGELEKAANLAGQSQPYLRRTPDAPITAAHPGGRGNPADPARTGRIHEKIRDIQDDLRNSWKIGLGVGLGIIAPSILAAYQGEKDPGHPNYDSGHGWEHHIDEAHQPVADHHFPSHSPSEVHADLHETHSTDALNDADASQDGLESIDSEADPEPSDF